MSLPFPTICHSSKLRGDTKRHSLHKSACQNVLHIWLQITIIYNIIYIYSPKPFITFFGPFRMTCPQICTAHSFPLARTAPVTRSEVWVKVTAFVARWLCGFAYLCPATPFESYECISGCSCRSSSDMLWCPCPHDKACGRTIFSQATAKVRDHMLFVRPLFGGVLINFFRVHQVILHAKQCTRLLPKNK